MLIPCSSSLLALVVAATAPAPVVAPGPAPAPVRLFGPAPPPLPPQPSPAEPTSPTTEPAQRVVMPRTEAPDDPLADLPSDDIVPHELTLPELFELLRTQSPRLKAAQAQIELARARKVGARVLPNPILNFQVLHLISGYNQNGFGTYTFYFQQPVLIGGQRLQRGRAARAAERAAHSDVEAAYHDLAAEGRHVFVALQARQRHHEVLRAAIEDLRRLEGVVKTRHDAGAESRYDVSRIGLEVRRWRAKTIASTADIRDVSGQLGVLVGRPAWRPRAAGSAVPMGIDGDAEALWPDVERTQPAIRAAKDRVELADRDLAATRREVWPQPTIGLGVVGIDNFFSMSVLGGITTPLPLFDWGQGPVAKAKAEKHVAQVEKDAHTEELRAELDRVLSVLRDRQRALRGFERGVLAETTALQRMAEDAYVTGQVEILELIDAVETHYDLELERVELIEAVMHAEIDVLHVIGRVEDLP